MDYAYGNVALNQITSHNPYVNLLCDLDASCNQIITRGMTTQILSAGGGNAALAMLSDLDMSLNTVTAAALRALDVAAGPGQSWINVHSDLDVTNHTISVKTLAGGKNGEGLTLTGGKDGKINILSNVFSMATLNYNHLVGHSITTDTLRLNAVTSALALPGAKAATTPDDLTLARSSLILNATTGITFPDQTVQSTAYEGGRSFLRQARRTEQQNLFKCCPPLLTVGVPMVMLGTTCCTVAYAVTIDSQAGSASFFVKINGHQDLYSVTHTQGAAGIYTPNLNYICLPPSLVSNGNREVEVLFELCTEVKGTVTLLSAQLQVRR